MWILHKTLTVKWPEMIVIPHTWNDLLKIFILDVLSLIAYSPSDDQANSNADPNDLFLQASAV